MRLKDFAAHSTPKFNIAKLIPIETLPALSRRAASPILLHTSLVLSPEPADTPHKNRLAHQTQLWFGIQVLFSRCCRAQSLHAVIKHTLAGPATNQFIMASYFCDHITEHRIIRAHSKGRKGRYSLLLTLSLPNPTRVCTRVTETVKWKQLLHSFTKIRRNWTSFQPFRKLLNSWLSCWDRMSSIWGQKANRKKSPVEILAIFVPFALFFFICSQWNTSAFMGFLLLFVIVNVCLVAPSPHSSFPQPRFTSIFQSESFSPWLTPQVLTSARKCSQAMAAHSDLCLTAHSSPWEIMNGNQPFVKPVLRAVIPEILVPTKHMHKLLQ